MKTELADTAARVEQAVDYLAVFGPCDGDSAKQARYIKRAYRKLALVLHPDKYANPDDQALAKESFTRLGEFLDQANQAVKEGIYGQPVILATVRTRKAEHTIISRYAVGDLSTVYATRSVAKGDEFATITKVALNHTDNDLLSAEATALRRLLADGTDPKLHPFVPKLVDSFTYVEKGRPNRVANVLGRLEGFYDLAKVLGAFPAGLDPLHAVWIWRRLLVTLGHAHDSNVVHGAVLPAHIMIMPEQHGVVLIDWCYASVKADNNFPPIKAIVDAKKDWYPEEVMAKKPPSPATDIAMAARSMVYLMGGDPLTGNLPIDRVPRALRAFCKGCLQTRQTARPGDAWELLTEFDELLARMGRPYHPRKFRPFSMPTGME